VSDVGGTAVPATMAEEMQDLGPITPALAHGSSATSASLGEQERMGGQSQRPPSIEKEERPAFEPEQAERSGVGLHSATQARQVKGNAKPDSGGDQPTVTPLASKQAQVGAERSVVAARTREATGETPVRSVRARSDGRLEAASGEAVWPPEAAEMGGSRSSDLPAPSEAPAAAPAAALQVQLDEELSKRAAGRSGRHEGPGEQGAALSSRDLRDSQEGEGGIEDWLGAKPDSRVSAAGDGEAENCPGPAAEDAPAVALRPLKGRDWSKYLDKAPSMVTPQHVDWSYTASEPQAGADSKVSEPVAKEAGSQGGAAGVQERALALEAQNQALLRQIAQLQAQVANAAGTSVPVDIGQVVRQMLSPPSGGNTAAQAMPQGSSAGGISAADGPTTPLPGTGAVANRVAEFQTKHAAAAASGDDGRSAEPAPSRSLPAGVSAVLDRDFEDGQGGAFGDESFTSVSESETRTASVGLGPDGLTSPEVSAQPTRTDSVTQRGSGLTTTVNNSEAELNFDDSAWASVDKSDDESESRSTAPPSTPVTVSPEAIEEFRFRC